MVSIILKNVGKRYGATVAVENVSLQIERGELFFLLGPSGCGKTTILRIIAGFIDPEPGGEVYFDARRVTDVPPNKRNTGMVFQNYALWPHMNVAENVAYGLRERKVSRAEREERVSDALRSVRMEGYAARMPNQLSGGQQQRVALARALVIEPDAVLLDEPLSNLDAKLRLEMRHEIRRIHAETGITMLYVTHDQKESLSMADRLAVMSMGRVEQIGDPRSVYRSPANVFVAGFIGEANMIAGTLLSADGEWGRVKTDIGEFRGRIAAAPIEQGARVLCMVRPECLRLGGGGEQAAETSAVNAFRARVEANVYLGEVEQFLVRAGEHELRAVIANPGESAPGAGEEVEVNFAAEDAVLLPAETEEARE
ncbi:MAG: ABC transporter ATP-binding protein [Candidatus Brocadiia bacterium]|nr:ABC transporter ATP-binding protein [Candidatus Brocadiia bacterium]